MSLLRGEKCVSARKRGTLSSGNAILIDEPPAAAAKTIFDQHKKDLISQHLMMLRVDTFWGGQRAVLPLPQPTAAKLFRSLPAIWKFDSFNSFENVSVSRYLMNFFFVCVLLLLVANCPRINEQVAPLPAVSSGSAVVICEVKLNDFNSIKIPF